jgi:hypothetical protein
MTYAQNMQPSFIAARGRTTAMTVLVIVQVVLLAIAAVAWLVGAASLDSDLTSAQTSFTAAAGLAGLDQLVFWSTAVVFLTWTYRATANLPALGSMSAKFTPGSAVWWYFIPFANLVQGHAVMANIWTESQPPAVNENGFYLPRKAMLVHWWWGLYLLTTFGAFFVGVSALGRPSIDALRTVAHGQSIWLIVRAATALMFLFMIRGAQKRQEDQWQDLERRRTVPQPTAEALR